MDIDNLVNKIARIFGKTYTSDLRKKDFTMKEAMDSTKRLIELWDENLIEKIIQLYPQKQRDLLNWAKNFTSLKFEFQGIIEEFEDENSIKCITAEKDYWKNIVINNEKIIRDILDDKEKK